MSYYDVPEGSREREIGRRIYMDALAGRRGFRDDQLGIEDEEIWAEIFEHIGRVAAAATGDELIPRLENCGRYLAEDNTGRWHYLNHANTWQGFQGPSAVAVSGEEPSGETR